MEFITLWAWSLEDAFSGFLSATVVFGAIWALFYWRGGGTKKEMCCPRPNQVYPCDCWCHD